MQSLPSGSTKFIWLIHRGQRIEQMVSHNCDSAKDDEVLCREQLDDNREREPQVGQGKP